MNSIALPRIISPEDLDDLVRHLEKLEIEEKIILTKLKIEDIKCKEEWENRPKDYDIYTINISTAGYRLIHKCGYPLEDDGEGGTTQHECYECGESLENAKYYCLSFWMVDPDEFDINLRKEFLECLDPITLRAYKAHIDKNQIKLVF